MSITKLEQSHIDLNKVKPLNANRLVAFINHMVIRVTQQLNDLVLVVDTRLERINTKINQCQANLTVLETKLNSVPGLVVNVERPTPAPQPSTAKPPDVPQASTSASVPTTVATPTTAIPVPTQQQNGHAHQPSALEESSGSSAATSQVEQQPQQNGDAGHDEAGDDEEAPEDESEVDISRFTKMLKFGIPFPAVQQKMIGEGYDPNLLRPAPK